MGEGAAAGTAAVQVWGAGSGGVSVGVGVGVKVVRLDGGHHRIGAAPHLAHQTADHDSTEEGDNAIGGVVLAPGAAGRVLVEAVHHGGGHQVHHELHPAPVYELYVLAQGHDGGPQQLGGSDEKHGLRSDAAEIQLLLRGNQDPLRDYRSCLFFFGCNCIAHVLSMEGGLKIK
jgi:hypothetical protein